MRHEPTAEPFVPSVKRLAAQALWWCVMLWPLTAAVAVVLWHSVTPLP